MNKELIKKYKAEFDHFIHGGDILVKYVNKLDADTGYEDWHKDDEVFESNLDYLVVIDDEYVAFRKAGCEGKQLQVSYPKSFKPDVWYDKAYHKISWSKSQSIRIKPEEPKFKVNDYVKNTSGQYLGQITRIDNHVYPIAVGGKGDRYLEHELVLCEKSKFEIGDWVTQAGSDPFQLVEGTCFLGLKLWKPQPKEWCWHIKSKQLIQISSKKSKRHDAIGHTTHRCPINIHYSDCEPYTNKLPSFTGN